MCAHSVGAQLAHSSENALFVALGRDLVAGVTIGAGAADIGQQSARFAIDIGAHVPGLGVRHERRIGEFVVMFTPGRFGLHRGFNRFAALGVGISNAVADPVACCCEQVGTLQNAAAGDSGAMIMNMFGKPCTCRPIHVRTPSRAQASRNESPSRPQMSMAVNEPVPASKPVAKISMSSGYSPSLVLRPLSVKCSMGVAVVSTKLTLGRLKTSK